MSVKAGSFGFGYDALSQRTSLTRPNGVNTSYSYDAVSHLLSVLHQAGGWLWSEAHPPFPSQEIVGFGFALLLVVGARACIRFVRSILSGKGEARSNPPEF